MSHWKENVAALKQTNEELYGLILKAYNNGDYSDEGFCVETARDGSNILGIMDKERKVMLNSTYRPKEEAVKFAGKIQLTENSLTFFFGIGNGLILSEIMGKLNEEALVFLMSHRFLCFVMFWNSLIWRSFCLMKDC